MTFEQFTKRPLLRNQWIEEKSGLHIYVRRSRMYDHGDYMLANMFHESPGQGNLTRFLDEWEPKYRFFVENIMNPRLEKYLERRGYELGNPLALLPCMLGPLYASQIEFKKGQLFDQKETP